MFLPNSVFCCKCLSKCAVFENFVWEWFDIAKVFSPTTEVALTWVNFWAKKVKHFQNINKNIKIFTVCSIINC